MDLKSYDYSVISLFKEYFRICKLWPSLSVTPSISSTVDLGACVPWIEGPDLLYYEWTEQTQEKYYYISKKIRIRLPKDTLCKQQQIWSECRVVCMGSDFVMSHNISFAAKRS